MAVNRTHARWSRLACTRLRQLRSLNLKPALACAVVCLAGKAAARLHAVCSMASQTGVLLDPIPSQVTLTEVHEKFQGERRKK